MTRFCIAILLLALPSSAIACSMHGFGMRANPFDRFGARQASPVSAATAARKDAPPPTPRTAMNIDAADQGQSERSPKATGQTDGSVTGTSGNIRAES